MEPFKCPVCKGINPYKKISLELNMGKEKKTIVDWIFDIRNPKLNSRMVIRACEKCHALSAWWEDFDSSKDVSDIDKEKAKYVLGSETLTEEETVKEGE